MIDAPQIEPISGLANRYRSLLTKLKNGPIFLAQRSRPAAVLVSVDEWTAIANELKRMRRILEADRQFAEIRAGDYVYYEDLDKELAAMNARSSEQTGN